MYVVTKKGRAAWEAADAAVPDQYRRMLWQIDVQGDQLALNGLRKLYTKALVADWVDELIQLGYLERGKRSDADITVPLDAEAIAAAGEAASQSLSSVGAYVAAGSMRALHAKKPGERVVLIVEDDPDQRALADLRVSMAGYRVRVAANANGMLWSLLNEPRPDILLLDVMLPDGNGFDILPKLRRHPSFSSVVIILLTAMREPESIGKGLALGAHGYIAKPYSKNVLKRVFDSIIGHAPA